jgi:hypothetical protein
VVLVDFLDKNDEDDEEGGQRFGGNNVRCQQQ